LDIGCGEGKLSNFLAMALGKEVCGIDISDFKLAKAWEVAEAQGISHLVQFIQGDASHLDFLADKSFAAIISIFSLHELENPRKVMKELRRVLRAKGRLIVVDFIPGARLKSCGAKGTMPSGKSSSC